MTVRKSPRIKCRIVASVHEGSSGVKEIAALISDISATGLSLDCTRELGLGDKGDSLSMAFRIQLHQIGMVLAIQGVIRARLDIDNSSMKGMVRHGIEFKNLTPNDCIILKSMIYEQMIDNPKSIM